MSREWVRSLCVGCRRAPPPFHDAMALFTLMHSSPAPSLAGSVCTLRLDRWVLPISESGSLCNLHARMRAQQRMGLTWGAFPVCRKSKVLKTPVVHMDSGPQTPAHMQLLHHTPSVLELHYYATWCTAPGKVCDHTPDYQIVPLKKLHFWSATLAACPLPLCPVTVQHSPALPDASGKAARLPIPDPLARDITCGQNIPRRRSECFHHLSHLDNTITGARD